MPELGSMDLPATRDRCPTLQQVLSESRLGYLTMLRQLKASARFGPGRLQELENARLQARPDWHALWAETITLPCIADFYSSAVDEPTIKAMDRTWKDFEASMPAPCADIKKEESLALEEYHAAYRQHGMIRYLRLLGIEMLLRLLVWLGSKIDG